MTLRVHNAIAICDDGIKIPRPVEHVKTIVVHRIGRELGTTCTQLAQAFKDTDNQWSAGSYTGGQFPYTFFIDPEGYTYQTLALADTGWHALRWSKIAYGIAVSGDFRRNHPTPPQWEALAQLCSVLAYWMRIYDLFGHTELPNASKEAGKQCPGKHLDMDRLRAEVAGRVRGTTDLENLGRELVLQHYGLVV